MHSVWHRMALYSITDLVLLFGSRCPVQELLLVSAGVAVHAFPLRKDADQVLGQQLVRVLPVTRTTEGDRRVPACGLEDDVLATRMLAQEVRDVVDLVEDHDPTVVQSAVLSYLIQGKFWKRTLVLSTL